VSAHDRVGHRRTDEEWLAATWADSGTAVVPLADGRFPVVETETETETGATRVAVAWQEPSRTPAGERLFLGDRDGRAHFAVLLDAGPDAAPDLEADTHRDWVALRAVASRLSTSDLDLLVHATALAEWHAAHRHCPRCGGLLRASAAGHVLTCGVCAQQQFPRTDPAVIMLVTDGDRALLGRNPRWPPGRYSTLAGFVEPGESLEAAVVREVAEEVGVVVDDVSYVGNQPWPFPASLMVGFFARAVTTDIEVDGDEISDARWFTREQMRDEAEAGTLVLPGGISISRRLVERWYGGPLPGQW